MQSVHTKTNCIFLRETYFYLSSSIMPRYLYSVTTSTTWLEILIRISFLSWLCFDLLQLLNKTDVRVVISFKASYIILPVKTVSPSLHLQKEINSDKGAAIKSPFTLLVWSHFHMYTLPPALFAHFQPILYIPLQFSQISPHSKYRGRTLPHSIVIKNHYLLLS